MSDDARILAATQRVLIVDWPSREVPDSLLAAGFTVFTKSGPGPHDYGALASENGTITRRSLDAAPRSAELVYVHRPVDELPGIVALAKGLGASTLWYQSGLCDEGTKDSRGCWLAESASAAVRSLVEGSGLLCILDEYIVEAVRRAQLQVVSTSVEFTPEETL